MLSELRASGDGRTKKCLNIAAVFAFYCQLCASHAMGHFRGNSLQHMELSWPRPLPVASVVAFYGRLFYVSTKSRDKSPPAPHGAGRQGRESSDFVLLGRPNGAQSNRGQLEFRVSQTPAKAHEIAGCVVVAGAVSSMLNELWISLNCPHGSNDTKSEGHCLL